MYYLYTVRLEIEISSIHAHVYESGHKKTLIWKCYSKIVFFSTYQQGCNLHHEGVQQKVWQQLCLVPCTGCPLWSVLCHTLNQSSAKCVTMRHELLYPSRNAQHSALGWNGPAEFPTLFPSLFRVHLSHSSLCHLFAHSIGQYIIAYAAARDRKQ